ncbi:patatin-like phospholipase family protein [Candidatus Pacearchaeota archaeon]|nr:patatin-like phospholipase family protein [Candidatus Pacearchaeota archaeon]
MDKNKLKIGIALGSGGARGLSHIGVLKVLEKNNIPIDYIVGCSMGAIIGANYALNPNIKEEEEKVLSLTKRDLFKLVDLVFPKKALISGKKIKKFIKKLINDKSFSDTKIPLRIIATDLESGKEVRISKGKLADAVRASISTPGIFLPVRFGKRLLIDGGLVNPTPIDVVKTMGADIIIGVDLTTQPKTKFKNPSIGETLIQSFRVLRAQTVKSNLYNSKNTIIIKPCLSSIDSYKFYNAQKFIEEGERATKKALPKIKKLIKENSKNKILK